MSYNFCVTLAVAATCVFPGLFKSCISLKRIEITDGVASVGTDAFSGYHKWPTLRISEKTQEHIFELLKQTCFEQFIIEEGNELLTVIDGFLYSKDKQSLLRFPAVSAHSHYVYDSEAPIDPGDNFVVPEYVARIADSAFRGTNIKRLDILDNVKNIGRFVVKECRHLKELHFVVKSPQNTDIDDYAFHNNYINDVKM